MNGRIHRSHIRRITLFLFPTMTSPHFLLLCALFGLAVSQAVQTGFVVRFDYLANSDCSASSLIRSAYTLVNVCAPPSYDIVTYAPSSNNSQPIQVQYYTDGTCSVAAGGPSLFGNYSCFHGTQTDYLYTYTSVLPALVDGWTTYAVYDPSASNCQGKLFYLDQTPPICYPNAYGSSNSQVKICNAGSGSLNTTSCTDTGCTVGCSAAMSTLTNVCNANTVNSCGVPSTVTGVQPSSSGTGTAPGGTGQTVATAAGSSHTNTNTGNGSPGPSSPSSASSTSALGSLLLVVFAALAL